MNARSVIKFLADVALRLTLGVVLWIISIYVRYYIRQRRA